MGIHTNLKPKVLVDNLGDRVFDGMSCGFCKWCCIEAVNGWFGNGGHSGRAQATCVCHLRRNDRSLGRALEVPQGRKVYTKCLRMRLFIVDMY